MNNKGLLIYLADDDKEDCSFFREALLKLPFNITVRTFNNGVDLIAALIDPISLLPHMIFLDLYMPLMNGEECLEDIKNESELESIPVIIYSSYIDPEKTKVLQRKGADRFIEKPNSIESLKSILQNVIASISVFNSDNNEMAGTI